MTAPLAFESVALGRLRRRTLAPLESGEQSGDPGFTLVVDAGQSVLALGDESSGVDSLAAVILGLAEAPAGACRVFGVELSRLDRRAQLAYRRRVGYLPAGDGLLHNLSLRDNIGLPLRFGSDLRLDQIEARLDQLLQRLRLHRVASLRPADANEEERRRAALARALASSPELLVLEEPFSGLTDRAAMELFDVAREGAGGAPGGRTLFITGQSFPAPLRTRLDREVKVIRGQAVEEPS
ncbi:MAG: ATP-binding cassette domain-containing protein [Gemmatimonadales bacterium]